jgi:EpsI family protein
VLAAVVLTAAALALGPAWSLAERANSTPADGALPSVAGWSGPEMHLSDWRPSFAGPDQELLVTYHNDSAGDVALYRAVYHSQRQGKELRGEGNSVVGEGYRTQASRARTMIVAGETVTVAEELAVAADGRELVVWSLFAVDGRPDPMRLQQQLNYGIRSLVLAPTASVIAFAAECRPDCEDARSALGTFASQSLPYLLASAGPQLADAAASGDR